MGKLYEILRKNNVQLTRDRMPHANYEAWELISYKLSILKISKIFVIFPLTSYKRLTNAFHAENASLSGMMRADS